ncbi:hypothetical protein ACC870_37525, partial [Rhizobium ruizarguesonis]
LGGCEGTRPSASERQTDIDIEEAPLPEHRDKVWGAVLTAEIAVNGHPGLKGTDQLLNLLRSD